MDVAERLAVHGFTVVPHLSARLVRDRAHLEEVAGRLLAAGVHEVFVPAGDADPPAGEFHGAADLLRAMGELRGSFSEIGITGYPESHHVISDEETIQAMFAKAPMATCIISQICFDAAIDRDLDPPTCARAAPTCRSGSACRGSSTTRSSCASR